MSNKPFRITTYDGDFQRTGWVTGYEDFVVTPMHNAIGGARFTLPANNPRVVDLLTPGARCYIEYLDGDAGDEFVMSGPVRVVGGQGPRRVSTITFNVEDDFRVLSQILAWPNPGEDIFHQGYDDDGESLGDYHRLVGPAETVMKGFLLANAPRLGIPIVTYPDDLRGDDIDVRMRFHYLNDDRLLQQVEQAGLGVTVRQVSNGSNGGGLVMNVYEPEVRTRIITEESGVLIEWGWTQSAPTNSRVIAAGQGEGIDRDFRLKTDTAREVLWGAASATEFFRDARDVDLGNYDLLDKRADQALAEGAQKTGLKLTLAETKTFRYGRTAVVGDTVTVQIAPGVEITDVLRSATLEHSTGDGLKITPSVGLPEGDNNDMLIAKAIAKLGAGLRDLRAGR